MATGTLIADTLNCASGVFPTHLDERGKGGYMVLPSIAERDGLDPSLLKKGMLVHTIERNSGTYGDGTFQLESFTGDGHANYWKEVLLEEPQFFDNRFQLKSNITDVITDTTLSSNQYPSTKGMADYLDANYTTTSDYTITTIGGNGNSQNVSLDDLHSGTVKLLTPDSKIVYSTYNVNPYSKHSLHLEVGATRDMDAGEVPVQLGSEYNVVVAECYKPDISIKLYLNSSEGSRYFPECYVYLINLSGSTINITHDFSEVPITDIQSYIRYNGNHRKIPYSGLGPNEIFYIKYTIIQNHILYDAIIYEV